MTDIDEAPASSPTRGKSLWHNRDFMYLWVGQSASEIGSGITQMAMPLVAVLVLDVSTLAIGMLSAVTMLPFLLVALPAGAIVDRRAKHRLMMWCDVGRLLLIASIALVMIPGLDLGLTYAHLMIVALLSGILTVFFDVAYQSYLPTLLDREELREGNSKLGTTQSFARFAAPPLGGGLIAVFGAAWTFAVDTFTYTISVVSLFRIKKTEPAPEPRPVGQKMRYEIADGLRFVFKQPVLRKIVASTGTSNLFTSMSFAMETIFLVRVLDVEPGLVGLVFAVMGAGGMVGGIFAERLSRWFGTARIIWLSGLVFQLPMFLIPLATPGWGVLLFMVGSFFLVASSVVYNVSQLTYRQAITPPAMLGRMNASVRFIVWGTMPLGSALGGVLGSQFGIRETLWIAMIGAWSAGLWVFFSPLRKKRDIEELEEYRANQA
ncbi:MFS transporter [Streptomyces avicenniae]|uniref:MFS transporter n=1 Tax=Streptomyces avicenniae TaxID=500153 RepID=UPI00069BC7E6|nr:MFS transporter [Streptomyces avicenniae]